MGSSREALKWGGGSRAENLHSHERNSTWKRPFSSTRKNGARRPISRGFKGFTMMWCDVWHCNLQCSELIYTLNRDLWKWKVPYFVTVFQQNWKPALKRNGKRVQIQDLLNKVWKLGCVQKRALQQLPLRWFKLKESTCECLLTLEIQWEQMQIHLTTRRGLTDQREPR